MYSIPQLAQRFKGASSHWLRQHMGHMIARFMNTRTFWTCGYFYETVGSVTAKAREFYFDLCQDKYWKNIEPIVWSENQARLTNWMAR